MSASTTWSSLTNAVIYQVGWFACVLGAAWGRGTAGAVVALILVGLHLTLAQRPALELPVLAAAGVIGIAADSLHAAFGVLEFSGHTGGSLAPLWIVALWIQFGTVLHFCMRWLSGSYLLASCLGLIGGPVSFLAGERLGAAAFGEPRMASLTILALTWSLALPSLVMIADRVSPGSGSYRFPAGRAFDGPAVSAPVRVRTSGRG